jgi:hypothetical protein
MRVAVRREPFERDNLFSNSARNRQPARPHGAAIHQYGARTALPQPTPEPRIVQRQIVPQDVKKRTLRVHVESMRLPIYF